jgi:asparagine synthase (glutamine-hydrolysing)
MCGIGGVVGPGDHRDEVASMLEMIRHRGPDGGGCVQDGPACVGMRRLSIIDVEGGQQPMATEDGRVVIVFNGEIYNYVELRDALQLRGHAFTTHSDTEVLLRAYLEFGTACVDHLRGMFAFAVWDRSRERLFIARDRLGEKPLYYGLVGGRFAFSSELKAFTCLTGFAPELDSIAVAQYFTYQYVPAPRTIFRSVNKLLPGHALTWTRGQLHTWRYWEAPFAPPVDSSLSEGEALARFTGLLEESVALRMRSDVPVGALLSGGLDSSVIVALMARRTSRPVQTFTVGFSGPGLPDDADESAFARRVARHLGTDHHELRVEASAIEALPAVVWHMDEPFADAAALPTFQIAALARRHVKVALTGEGADELFGSYRFVRTLYFLSLADRLPPELRRVLVLLAGPLGAAPPRTLTSRLAGVLRRAGDDLPTRYRKTVSLFDDAGRQALLRPLTGHGIAASGALESDIDLPPVDGVADPLNWHLAALNAAWLPDDLLMKVDKMTMAAGLEARTPFLDHRLVEEVARFPASYKLRPRRAKYLLRRLAETLLPPWAVNRPKHGFDVPIDAWLRGPLRPMLRDTLTGEMVRKAGVLDAGEVDRLIAAHLEGRRPTGRQLWAILCFQLWYDRFLGSAHQSGTSAPCESILPRMTVGRMT